MLPLHLTSQHSRRQNNNRHPVGVRNGGEVLLAKVDLLATRSGVVNQSRSDAYTGSEKDEQTSIFVHIEAVYVFQDAASFSNTTISLLVCFPFSTNSSSK
jgi:hypothetical protein